jgi:hypothetical protein
MGARFGFRLALMATAKLHAQSGARNNPAEAAARRR